jgi:hypothetical protein
MEREHDSRTSEAASGISSCREYASATLGEIGDIYIYGTVCRYDSGSTLRSPD